MVDKKPQGETSPDALPTVRSVVIDLLKLTDDQRMDVFYEFCRYCGSDNPRCQCANDE